MIQENTQRPWWVLSRRKVGYTLTSAVGWHTQQRKWVKLSKLEEILRLCNFSVYSWRDKCRKRELTVICGELKTSALSSPLYFEICKVHRKTIAFSKFWHCWLSVGGKKRKIRKLCSGSGLKNSKPIFWPKFTASRDLTEGCPQSFSPTSTVGLMCICSLGLQVF